MLHLMKSELETVLNESTETNLSPASVAGPGKGGYRIHEAVVRTQSAAAHLPLATSLGRVLTDNVRECGRSAPARHCIEASLTLLLVTDTLYWITTRGWCQSRL